MPKSLNLCLHCGGKEVSRDALEAVRTPPPTATWMPIPHALLVDRVRDTLSRSGLSIVAEAHGLARDGDRYFGLLQVANGENADDYGLVVGIRNSHDQSFPAALALGSGVFVCDNLAFSGEVKLARKHTRYIERDLAGLVDKAVGLLGDHRHGQDLRIAAYKRHEVSDPQAHDALINALDARIIGATQLPKVLEEWRAPSHPDFRPRTAWSLFNCFTEVLKGNANLCLPRSQKLHGLMDSLCGIAA
jgi:hypothetical protein